MKFLRVLWRVIYSIVAPVVLIAFVLTIFSIQVNYAYGADSAVSGDTMTFTINGSLDFISPLLSGSNFGFIGEMSGKITNVHFDVTTGSLAYDLSTTSFTPTFTPMEWSYEMLPLIAALLVVVGSFVLCVGYGSKIITFIGTIALIGGSVLLFTQQGCFDSFSFVIANSGSGSEPLVNQSISWLSMGITLIVSDLLALLNFLLVITKRKKIAA